MPEPLWDLLYTTAKTYAHDAAGEIAQAIENRVRGDAEFQRAVLEAMGEVHPGAFNHKGRDQSDSSYWQVVDLPYARRWGIVNFTPVFVVAPHPEVPDA